MVRSRANNSFVGVLLILIGLAFLIGQVSDVDYSWTFLLMGLGLAFLVRNVIEGRAVTVFPGVLLSLLGIIFFAEEQNLELFGVWEAWPFVPVSVGFAFLAEWVFNRQKMGLLLTAIILLGVGGLFVAAESRYVEWRTVGDVLEWWPVLLLITGAWLLVRKPNRGHPEVGDGSTPPKEFKPSPPSNRVDDTRK